MQRILDTRTRYFADQRVSLEQWLWDNPGRLVGLVAIAHVIVWTLAPTLSHTGLPLDVVEGYAFGGEWVIGTFKHPALPSWLLEISRQVTGVLGWPAYLLSSLSIAATYVLVYLTGREVIGSQQAAAGTLLLSGLMYFSWVTPEFNHNVVQMPLWMGLIWSLVRARNSGDTFWWILVGVFGAVGLYAKFAMAVLIISAAVFILVDRRCRRQLASRGPWLGLLVFLVLTTPLLVWLVKTDFYVFNYAEARATSGKAGTIAQFLLKQIYSSVGLYVLIVLAFGFRWLGSLLTSDELLRRLRHRREPLRLLIYLHGMPLLVACSAMAIKGGGMKGSWGTPMLSLSGLVAVSLASRAFDAGALKRIAIATAGLLIVTPAVYAVMVLQWDRISKTPHRMNWPQAEIATRLQEFWRKETGQPLKIVGGDLWMAGMVAAHASDRPSILVDGDFSRAPWISRESFHREGALFVWRGGPVAFARLIEGRPITGDHVVVKGRRREADIHYHYVIVPPAGQSQR